MVEKISAKQEKWAQWWKKMGTTNKMETIDIIFYSLMTIGIVISIVGFTDCLIKIIKLYKEL
jgi:hypothetical protein